MLDLSQTGKVKIQKVGFYTMHSTSVKCFCDVTGIIQVLNIKCKSFAEPEPWLTIIPLLLLQNYGKIWES